MSSVRRIIFLLAAAAGCAALLWSANDFFALLSGDRLGASACTISAYWNCDRASLSAAGSIFSIPIGVFGAFWFLLAAILALLGTRYLRGWLAFGMAMAIFMGAYLVIVVEAGCVVCYVSYGLIGLMAVIGWKGFSRIISVRAAVTAVFVVVLGLAAFVAHERSILSKRFSEEEFSRWLAYEEVVPLVSPLMNKASDQSRLTVVKFSDFGCPFCAKANQVIVPFIKSQPDITYVFFPYPLDSACNSKLPRPVHPYSCEWSKAVLCAQQQDKSWALHDAIFERVLKGQRLVSMGEWFPEIGIDRGALDRCMQEPETQERLLSIVRVGQELNIESTPTFFLNGRRFSGLVPMGLLQRFLHEVR